MADFGIGEVLSIAGTAAGAIGAIGQGQAAAAQANYQAQVARNNAIVAQQNANYAIASGEAKATDEGMKERARAGAVRAALAASGLDVNSGSSADVQEGSARTGQTNIERVRQEAQLRAYGYRSQATNFGAEAGLDRLAASNAQTAGFLKAGGLLFSGASGLIGSKWGGPSSSALGDWSPRPTSFGGVPDLIGSGSF